MFSAIFRDLKPVIVPLEPSIGALLLENLPVRPDWLLHQLLFGPLVVCLGPAEEEEARTDIEWVASANHSHIVFEA